MGSSVDIASRFSFLQMKCAMARGLRAKFPFDLVISARLLAQRNRKRRISRIISRQDGDHISSGLEEKICAFTARSDSAMDLSVRGSRRKRQSVISNHAWVLHRQCSDPRRFASLIKNRSCVDRLKI
jgi:hypothetical protein